MRLCKKVSILFGVITDKNSSHIQLYDEILGNCATLVQL